MKVGSRQFELLVPLAGLLVSPVHPNQQISVVRDVGTSQRTVESHHFILNDRITPLFPVTCSLEEPFFNAQLLFSGEAHALHRQVLHVFIREYRGDLIAQPFL